MSKLKDIINQSEMEKQETLNSKNRVEQLRRGNEIEISNLKAKLGENFGSESITFDIHVLSDDEATEANLVRKRMECEASDKKTILNENQRFKGELCIKNVRVIDGPSIKEELTFDFNDEFYKFCDKEYKELFQHIMSTLEEKLKRK